MKNIYLFIILIFFAISSRAQQVLLYAGHPDTSGQNATSVPLLDAYFYNPCGLAFDSWGNLWVSEWSNHTIRMITPDGQVYTKAGGFEQDCFKNAAATTSRFSNPAGICVGKGDTIYVADQGNHVIRKIDPYQGQVGQAHWCDVKAGKFSAPGPGNPNCLTRYPGYKDGKWLEAQFDEPADVCSDKFGNLYVADKNNHVIRKIDTLGYVTTIAGTPGVSGDEDGNALSAKFWYPVGVSIDDNGDIYVAEWGNSKLRKISGGKVSTVLSFPPLWNPSDVIQDSRKIFYISDLARIIRYDKTNWSIFAGSPYHNGPTGYVNDTGTAARFNSIRQMVVDPKDYHFVYAADFNNHVIRKIVICDPYKVNLTLSGGTTFCKGDQLTLTAPDGYKKYMWSTGETTKSITVDKSATVYLKVENNDLCIGYSDTFKINVYTLKPSLIPTKKSFCAGDSAILVGQSGFDNYIWYKNGSKFIEGPNKQSLTIYDSGTYKLEVISGPCKGTSDEIKITLGSLSPTLNISGNKTLCQGDSLVVYPLENFPQYQWKKGTTVISSQKQIVIKEEGTYSLFVSNGAGCSGSSDLLVVTVYPKPPVPVITKQTDSLFVSNVMTGNQWYRNDTLIPNAVGQAYFVTKKGWYHVVVTNQYGCSSKSNRLPFGGIESMNENNKLPDISIFPNPTSNTFTVSLNADYPEIIQIRIINIYGSVILREQHDLIRGNNNFTYNTGNLAKGIYIVSVSGEKGIKNIPLIIR